MKLTYRAIFYEGEGGYVVEVPDLPGCASGFVSILVLDMDACVEKYGNKTARKNLTIPDWLNTYAESKQIN